MMPYQPLPCSSRIMRPLSGLTAVARLLMTATGSETEQSPNVWTIVSYCPFVRCACFVDVAVDDDAFVDVTSDGGGGDGGGGSGL